MRPDQFAEMSGFKSGGELYDANMDAIAQETIYGMAGCVPMAYWPSWLRIRARARNLDTTPQPGGITPESFRRAQETSHE